MEGMAMATFRQLQALVAVIDFGSFEAAAAQLGVVQSAVSRQINDLEAWLGFALFDRSRRVATLTSQGAPVVEQARHTLLQQELVDQCLTSPEVLARTLRLGITELSAMTWLPRFVGTLTQRYPKVRLEPDVDLSVRLHERLLAGRLDVIVVPDAFHSNGLLRFELDSVSNGWFCAPGVLPADRVLGLGDIGQQRLLAQGQLSGSGVLMSEWLATQGVATDDYLLCSSLVALVGMTASGLGVSYLPHGVAAPGLAEGTLQELQVQPPLPATRYVALARANAFGPFHREVVQLLVADARMLRRPAVDTAEG
jgi:DNA-binding transcriptional LysR family regulator